MGNGSFVIKKLSEGSISKMVQAINGVAVCKASDAKRNLSHSPGRLMQRIRLRLSGQFYG